MEKDDVKTFALGAVVGAVVWQYFATKNFEPKKKPNSVRITKAEYQKIMDERFDDIIKNI